MTDALLNGSRSLIKKPFENGAAPRRKTLAVRRTFAGGCNGVRRGATIVEVALVLPVFLVFVFAIIEFGHYYYVRNVIEVACREGARIGCTEGTTNAEVLDRVRTLVGTVADASMVSIDVKDASTYDGGGALPDSPSDLDGLPNMDVSDAESTQLFLVQAKVDYNDVALLPMPWFLGEAKIRTSAFMRHE